MSKTLEKENRWLKQVLLRDYVGLRTDISGCSKMETSTLGRGYFVESSYRCVVFNQMFDNANPAKFSELISRLEMCASTPRKSTCPLKKGPFQKESSLPTIIFQWLSHVLGGVCYFVFCWGGQQEPHHLTTLGWWKAGASGVAELPISWWTGNHKVGPTCFK